MRPVGLRKEGNNSDDLQLGQDKVGAKGEGCEECGEPEVSDDHEGRELP